MPSTTGLDHDHLWLEVAPDVSAAGLDLVAATEYGPSQAAGECVFVVAVEVEKSTYFGECEPDQASAGGRGRVVFG